jgi:hypothetical protein
MPDEQLVGGRFPEGHPEREAAIAAEANGPRQRLFGWSAELLGDRLWQFGVINYPLPVRPLS